MRDQVFISYSHEDEMWLKLLQTHLKPFKNADRLRVWSDERIASGDKWQHKIEEALGAAKVAVLLVSPNYLASDFVAQQELPPLLEAAKREGLRILWVAVSASAYHKTPIKDYHCTNRPAAPLDTLTPADLSLEMVKICDKICDAVSGAADDEENACDDEEDKTSIVETTRPPGKPARRRRKRPSALVGAAVGVVLLLAVAGAALYFWRAKPPLPPLRPAPVDDEFVNADKWTVPPSGWRIDMSNGGSLEVTNQPQVGYLTGVSYRDFEAHFNLKLLSNRGAAWALRVNGEGDYYLFYLSGPQGLYPNRFVAYVVRDGKRDPKTERTTNVVAELKEGQFYRVDIKAEGSKITTVITPAATGEEVKLGDFIDPDDTHPRGSFGFLTVNGEKFSVDDLFIVPPGTAPNP